MRKVKTDLLDQRWHKRTGKRFGRGFMRKARWRRAKRVARGETSGISRKHFCALEVRTPFFAHLRRAVAKTD